MKLLLDTQVVLWWLSDAARLPADATQAIQSRDNTVIVSVVSLWEIVIKVRVKKLMADIDRVETAIDAGGLERLPIKAAHLVTLASLPILHKDPFDHLLVAQAISEGAKLISSDRALRAYPVELL